MTSSSEEFKAEGNTLFGQKKYKESAVAYTKAIKADPNNHVLYSNRSAAFAKMLRFSRAIDDAAKCTELKADWSKGFYRLAMAHDGAAHAEKAMEAIQSALEIDPDEKSYNKLYRDLKKKAPTAKDEHGARIKAMARASKDGIKSQEDYDRLVGGKHAVGTVPAASKASVIEFADGVIADMRAMIEQNMAMEHRAFFHRPTDTDDSPAAMVSIKDAFQTMSTIRECNVFLGNHALNIGADAAVIVMEKRHMTFWCPWRSPEVAKSDPPKWPFKMDEEGFFFEVASKEFREIRFVPVTHKRGKAVCGDAFVCDLEDFSPFANVFV